MFDYLYLAMRKRILGGKKASLLISLFFLYYVVLTSFPFVHNMKADLNFWNVKYYILLEGIHHHEDNLKSPCLDFHQTKLIEVGYCPVCNLCNNDRFLFVNYENLSFYNKFIEYYSPLNFSYFISLKYNTPFLRAPPLS